MPIGVVPSFRCFYDNCVGKQFDLPISYNRIFSSHNAWELIELLDSIIILKIVSCMNVGYKDGYVLHDVWTVSTYIARRTCDLWTWLYILFYLILHDLQLNYMPNMTYTAYISISWENLTKGKIISLNSSWGGDSSYPSPKSTPVPLRFLLKNLTERSKYYTECRYLD